MTAAPRARLRQALVGSVPPFAAIAAVLVTWEVWVRVANTPDYVLPPPSQVARAFVDTRSSLAGHLPTTLIEAGLGLAVGTTLGIAVAVAIAGSRRLRQVVAPLLVASQTIPLILLAPLLVLWFGFGLTPKVIVVALVTFFPVTVATAGGLTSADGELVELVRSMGAGRVDVMRHVLIPGALPALFDGLRISAAYTVGGAAIAEWVGGERGLGLYMARSQRSFKVDQVFVAFAVITALSIALFVAIGAVSRAVCPWRSPAALTAPPAPERSTP